MFLGGGLLVSRPEARQSQVKRYHPRICRWSSLERSDRRAGHSARQERAAADDDRRNPPGAWDRPATLSRPLPSRVSSSTTASSRLNWPARRPRAPARGRAASSASRFASRTTCGPSTRSTCVPPTAVPRIKSGEITPSSTISPPDWPWFRLRKETPSKYESYVDLHAGTCGRRIKIDVRGDRARLYVHDQEQPTLVVNDLKTGAQGKGAVGLCRSDREPLRTSAT